MSESDTPSTDAEAGYYDGSGCWHHRSNGECVDADFARTLERKLSAALARAEKFERRFAAGLIAVDRLAGERDKAEAERDAALAKVARYETLRQQLEIIAIGDSANPKADAGKVLVEVGFWAAPLPDVKEATK